MARTLASSSVLFLCVWYQETRRLKVCFGTPKTAARASEALGLRDSCEKSHVFDLDCPSHGMKRLKFDTIAALPRQRYNGSSPAMAFVDVDVLTEIDIERPRSEVAAYVIDQDNAPRWYVNIKSVEWKTPPPARMGSRVAFVAHFLGRRLVYTYEIVELVPGERLVMRTSEGPFPMETTYTWEARGAEGVTRMTLRNRGEPRGFSKLFAPFMASAMRRANTKDLARLKSLLEAHPD
jgi:hypothetical protein